MTESTPIAGVIFDFDGVVVDSEPLHFIAESTVVARHGGGELSQAHANAAMGMRDVDSYRYYAETFGLDATPEALVAEGMEIFHELVDQRLELMPGAAELIEWTQRENLRSAIASSGREGYIQRALARFGLQERFAGLVSCVDLVANGKPAPDVFIHAAGRIGLPTRACVVVEDTGNGIRAAKAAGMRAVRYLPEGGDDDLADAVVRNLTDVPAAIAGFTG